MDSANSGSMQSSSGGDEEYESSFLNPSVSFSPFSDQQPPIIAHQQSHRHNHHQPTFLDPHSQNLDAFANSSANTQYSHDLIWNRALRSDPNHGNLQAQLSSPSLSSNQSGLRTHPMLKDQAQFASSSSQSNQGNNPPRTSNQQPDQPKNPKKRTRASRRAPTTVLTTDTTNFRQMVQEFTGIPTAPFSTSPYSRRFDLFSGGGGGGGGGGAMRSGNLDPLYPLKPSAQKAQMPPFFAQSSSSSSLLSSTMIDALVSSTTASDHVGILSKQPQNLLNMQNQILSFQQPFLQSPLSTSTKGGGTSVPSFDELGLNHENLNTNLGNIQRWRDKLNRDEQQQQQPQQLVSFDANNVISSNVGNNYKFNCSASNSEFHSEKGLENVSSSGEATVGPWIRPSDH